MLESATFWVAVAFVITVGTAAYYGLRPALRGLDQRAEKIRKDIDEAERLREEAQRQLADYKKKQREAQREAEEIVEHAKAEAKRMRERAERELEEQLERRERLTMEKIEQAEKQALAEVRNRAVDIAVVATEQLLRDNMSADQHQKMVDSTIQGVRKHLH
jgi:F-type H+-transporting ATPase subunit b